MKQIDKGTVRNSIHGNPIKAGYRYNPIIVSTSMVRLPSPAGLGCGVNGPRMHIEAGILQDISGSHKYILHPIGIPENAAATKG